MESRKVLKELYIGIAIYAFICMIIGIIFIKPRWIYAVAIIVGAVGACLQAYNIYDSLDCALNLAPKNAKGYATSKSIQRLGMCAFLMTVAIILHTTAFVGVVIGLFGLKISAMFNPLISKLLKKLDRVVDTLDIEKK